MAPKSKKGPTSDVFDPNAPVAAEAPYDSTMETLAHIRHVNALMLGLCQILLQRAASHDASKLLPPEKEGFDNLTPMMKDVVFGTKEYSDKMAELQEVLDHHYAANSHHPQHYPNGIDGMTLIDLVEMFCDWKAASGRNKNGSFDKSMAHNTERFKMSGQLAQVFWNTKAALDW